MKNKNIDIDGIVADIKGHNQRGGRKNPVKRMMPAGIYNAAFSAGLSQRQNANFDGMEMQFSAAGEEGRQQVGKWTGRFGFDDKGRAVCRLFPMDGEKVVTKYSVLIRIGKS